MNSMTILNSFEMKPQKGKILIVDDAPSVAEFTRAILKPEYIVQVALNGNEAFAVLKDFKPDLLLLDVVMPDIDGIEVCKRIRSDNSFGFLKIIMVSSKTHINERMQGYEAGADDYLGKPFKREELLAKVRVFLRLKSVEDRLNEMNAQLNEQVKIRTDQLIDAERMAAIGKSSAGIVHNLNNPLQAVLGYTQLLEIDWPDSPYIKKLRDAALLMKEMIATILTTSRRAHGVKELDIDLNQLLLNQIEMFKTNSFFKHQVKTHLDLKPLPPYQGVYSHFSQSLGNLIKNAVEAMYQADEKVLSIETVSRKSGIRIRISDTGHGIKQENLAKIFDPFYTTKPLSAIDEEPTGTGIGLASSKEMIEAYGGKINVTSEGGKGTIFTVILPHNK